MRLARVVLGLMLDSRVPLVLKLVLPAAVVYFISPIDLLPDLILPVLGRVDDILVLISALVLFLTMAPHEVVLEHLRSRTGNRVNGDTKDQGIDSRANVIEGDYEIKENE